MHHFTTILFLLFVLCFSACSPSKEELTQKMEAGIKTRLEEVSAKDNSALTLYEVKVLDFEEIGEGRIDTLKRQQMANVINLYSKSMEDYKQRSEEEYVASFRAARVSQKLAEGKIETSKMLLGFSRQNQDSLTKYKRLDSIIAVRIKQRTDNSKNYYLANAIVKSTTGQQVELDTTRYVLTKDFKFYVFD